MISKQECPFLLFNSECEDICYHLLLRVLRWLLDFFQDFIFAFSGINGKESIAWSCLEPEFHRSVLKRGLLSIAAIMKCGEIKVNGKDLGLSLVKFLVKKTKQIPIYHQSKAIFFFFFLLECLITQSYLTLGNPMDCSLPGSSVHGIFQVRILEWVAISFSRGSSQPRD